MKLFEHKSKWADVIDQYGYRGIPNVDVTGSLNEKIYQEISNVREKLMQLRKLLNGSEVAVFHCPEIVWRKE